MHALLYCSFLTMAKKVVGREKTQRKGGSRSDWNFGKVKAMLAAE